MAINDTDKLLVNDGSKTETITFAQFKDGAVLNDSDKFLINDGTKTETITWAEIEDSLGPKGIVNTPIVLKPNDGAGSGEMIYLKTEKITEVESGWWYTHRETDTIQSVDDITDAPNVILTFPSSNGFDCFETNDLVQDTQRFWNQAQTVLILQVVGHIHQQTSLTAIKRLKHILLMMLMQAILSYKYLR